MGVDVRFSALLSLFSIRWYCWIEAAQTNITRTPVSSTLVELDLTEAVLGERLNSNLHISVVVFA